MTSSRVLDIFILEDEIDRFPRRGIVKALTGHNLTIARSCQDAKGKYLERKTDFDFLLLDHDMRGFYDKSTFHNTGYQFVKWLVETIIHEGKLPKVVLHSQNEAGRREMRNLLAVHKFKTLEFEFSMAYLEWLEKVK